MKDKKVLIVGNLYALTKHFSSLVKDVFVIPGNSCISDIATCVDIREDNAPEVLNFVLENDIDLTIVVSERAIKSDIVGLFQENGKQIFAPSAKSAEIAISKSQGKRFLYKLHVPTPKFGFFDKLQNAVDYLQEADYPVVISSDEKFNGKDCACFTVFEHAKCFVEDLFAAGIPKVVIEEYVYGQYFSLYCVTDGYNVLPVTTTRDFKFSENGDGGLYKHSAGCYCPDMCVPADVKNDIFNSVIEPAILKLQAVGSPYVGIFGVEGVMTGSNEYMILGFKPFVSDVEAQAVLNNTEEDLYDLFDSCANGFFADEYEDIIINDNVSVSCLVCSRSDGQEISNTDIIESEISFINAGKKDDVLCTAKGDSLVITSVAKTLSRAKYKLEEDINELKFDGIKYRSDIFS